MMTAPRADLAIGQMVGHGETPLKVIWRLLKQCPDEYPDPKTRLVPFVKDEALRASIDADIAGAYSALANDEFKAATVMAGATSEALLPWALQDPRVLPTLATLSPKPITAAAELEAPGWGLDKYISAAVHAGLINDTTQKALELARDYRNLIHPGRSKRLNAACSRGTAHGAIAALELLAQSLSARLP